jgi:hypothetical protein
MMRISRVVLTDD